MDWSSQGTSSSMSSGCAVNHRHAVARGELLEAPPAVVAVPAVLGRGPPHFTVRQRDSEHGAGADPPHLVGAGRAYRAAAVHGQHQRLHAHQIGYRYAATVGHVDERVTCDALAQV